MRLRWQVLLVLVQELGLQCPLSSLILPRSRHRRDLKAGPRLRRPIQMDTGIRIPLVLDRTISSNSIITITSILINSIQTLQSENESIRLQIRGQLRIPRRMSSRMGVCTGKDQCRMGGIPILSSSIRMRFNILIREQQGT